MILDSVSIEYGAEYENINLDYYPRRTKFCRRYMDYAIDQFLATISIHDECTSPTMFIKMGKSIFNSTL